MQKYTIPYTQYQVQRVIARIVLADRNIHLTLLVMRNGVLTTVQVLNPVALWPEASSSQVSHAPT